MTAGGDNATDSKSADAVVSVPLLSLYDCVKVRWGNDPMMRLLLAAAIVLPCLGCASVTRGTTENISISTAPAGATADISGLEIPTACVTPCVVVAKRSADITVTINKEGYEPQIIPLTKEIPGSGAAGQGVVHGVQGPVLEVSFQPQRRFQGDDGGDGCVLRAGKGRVVGVL